MPLKAKITGGQETAQALLALGRFSSASKVTRQALRPGAAGLRTAIRQNVTSEGLVDTGEYRRSIRVSTGRAARNTVGRLFVHVAGTRRRIAHLLEFGTRFMAARPHFRPALDANAEKVIRSFGQTIWPLIAREVRRLAVRSAVRRR